MRSVVFSTHLDDAVLSCYGVLGPETTVVTVLAGLPPDGPPGHWDVRGGAASSPERVQERQEEDRRALARSGSRHVHLDFLDGQYWPHHGAPTVEAIAESIRAYADSAAQVFAPAGIENPDHKLVRDAVLAARPDATLYADLPYALHPGFALPVEVRDADRRQHDVELDASVITDKLASVHCYVTQLPYLLEDFGDFMHPAGLGREVLWRRG